jgi:hypothetical protein
MRAIQDIGGQLPMKHAKVPDSIVERAPVEADESRE